MNKAILTDITKCIGCLKCVSACKEANGLQYDHPRDWQKDDGLSALNWTSVIGTPEDRYIRKQCRHCLEPACASACPVGALNKTELGAVIYDGSKCLGCRYCMMACPYGIPRYDWDKPVPYIRKCTLCYERIKAGSQPACTSACPVEATIFGERGELIRLARQRIDANPGKYVNKIWGERDIGGTSVMYVSDIDLGFLAYRSDMGTTPLPSTTEMAMESVPFAFAGMGAVMYGINWIIRRRMELGKIKIPEKDQPDE